jgi:uncharacterized membrane protein
MSVSNAWPVYLVITAITGERRSKSYLHKVRKFQECEDSVLFTEKKELKLILFKEKDKLLESNSRVSLTVSAVCKRQIVKGTFMLKV